VANILNQDAELDGSKRTEAFCGRDLMDAFRVESLDKWRLGVQKQKCTNIIAVRHENDSIDSQFRDAGAGHCV
jgi:hypothetical protein